MNGFIFQPEKFFPQCHGSTIEKLPDGRLMAAWFAGTKEGSPDTSIWGSVLEDGKWADPTVIIKTDDSPHWNPVLFNSKDGKIRLFFKSGERPESWETHWMSSRDGAKWTKPVLLKTTVASRGPVRSKPILLSNGDWVAPTSREILLPRAGAYSLWEPPEVIWDSFSDNTSDKGKKWELSLQVPLDRDQLGKYGGVIQPTLWQKNNGDIGMYLRSTYGWIFESESTNNGISWSQAKKTNLPNNNSGIDVVKLSCGLLIMAMNPVGGNWAKRTPLSLLLSKDDGKTWHGPAHIEVDNGSFSYPTLVETEAGVDVVYTWNRLSIVHRKISIFPLSSDEGSYRLSEIR